MVTQEKNGPPDESGAGLVPVARIDAPAWAETPEARAVMAALGEAQGAALFVGGCVRGALLGAAAGDVDIATKLVPQEVMARLERAGIRAVPTGIAHGTVTAVADGKPFEITSLRRDVETDGRRAVVAFTDDWREDAQRRDFTMNTLLADSQGHVFDPLGAGLADLTAGRVVFVGDPAARIAEDALRILRFFRFHALYGRGAPDAAALAACRAAADKVPVLSRERVAQEFFRMLAADNAADSLSLMFYNNILSDFFDLEFYKDVLAALCENQLRFGLKSVAARLWILCGMRADALDNVEKIMIVTKDIKKEIHLISEIMNGPEPGRAQDVKAAVYRHGREEVAQALLIRLSLLKIDLNKASEFIDIAMKWDVPVFPVTGAALIAQGYEPGPALGAKLKALEEEWIAGGFH